jgi:hypothetical protein
MKSGRNVSIPLVDISLLRLEGVIANGGFSTVLKATYQAEKVAVKAVPRTQDTQDAAFSVKAFAHECSVMLRLNHRCVCEFPLI